MMCLGADKRTILLLGPGCNTMRLMHSGTKPPFGEDPAGEDIIIIDRQQKVLDFWKERGATTIRLDLGNVSEHTTGLFPALRAQVDELHAYEVLNLLGGGIHDFFSLWRFLWSCLVPDGRVWASVPHWGSEWIHAYPGRQRTYTPGLLGYLDRASDNSAQEAFPLDWPEPYDFKLVNSWVWYAAAGPEAEKPQGWNFCLRKVEAQGRPEEKPI